MTHLPNKRVMRKAASGRAGMRGTIQFRLCMLVSIGRT
jgi:hypothetical protein